MPSANIVTKTICVTESGVTGITSGQMARFSVANMGESPMYILAGRFLDPAGKILRQDLERRAVGPAQAFLFDLDRRSVEAPGNRIEVQAVVEFTGDRSAVHSTTQVINVKTGRNDDDYCIPGNIVTKLVSFAHSGVVGIASGQMARFSVVNRGESPILILGGRFLDNEGKMLRQDAQRTAVGSGQAFLFDLERRLVEAPGDRIEVQAVVEFTGDPDAVATTTQGFDLKTGRSGGLWSNHNETVVRGAAAKHLAQDDRRLDEHQRVQRSYEKADRLLSRILQLTESRFGSHDLRLCRILNNLGVVRKYAGRVSECEPLYRRSLAIAEPALGPDHPELATIYHNLGGMEHARGRYEQGEEFARRAVEIRERALGPDHPDVAADVAALAAILDGQGKHEQAEPLHLRALAVLERVHGSENVDVAIALNNLAALHQAKGNREEAERLYDRALAMKEKVWGPAHPEVGITLHNLAILRAEPRRPEGRRTDVLSGAA